MDKEKWIETLLDDMVESQWSEDVIREEFDRLDKLSEEEILKSAEDLEPINQYSNEELAQQEIQQKDFQRQLENFSKSDYEDYLVSSAVTVIQEEEFFAEMEMGDEYYEGLIRARMAEEDFLDMVMKEAIAEDGYFQDYVERHYYESHIEDYEQYSGFEDDDIYYLEYPPEKEVFDDLGDTSYMDQGIFQGANTDSFEEPFEYVYYENPFIDDNLLDYGEEINALDCEDIRASEGYHYDESSDYINPGDAPDDLILEEPSDDSQEQLIRERLFEEKYLDQIFIEIIKRDEYWDRIISEKLAGDEKLKRKVERLG